MATKKIELSQDEKDALAAIETGQPELKKVTKEDLDNMSEDEINELKENIETLDELSKKTLGSYINNASDDAAYHTGKSDRQALIGNKSSSKESDKIVIKRRKGISKAVDKLTKEDLDNMSEDEINELVENIEQLDELSKATLGSYVKKATDDVSHDSFMAGSLSATKKPGSLKFDKKSFKRQTGISKAVDKLTKEDLDNMSEDEINELVENIETLDELSKKTLGSYINSAHMDKSHAAHEIGRENEKSASGQTPDFKYRSDNNKKHGKRSGGIGMAVQKLTGGAKVMAKESEEISQEEQEKMTKKIEETAAAESLSPNSHPDSNPASKIEAMKAVIGAMAAMTSDELTKFWNETLANSKTHVANAPDNSAHNKATISAKSSAAVKEDMAVIFDGQELSEEFKDKATTLFEAAISLQVTTEVARLEEEYKTKLEEALEEHVKTVSEAVESYLDYTVEQWMTENKVEIESALRSEITEEAISRIKQVFEDLNINLPEEKVDIVEELQLKVSELEAQLDKSIRSNNDLQEQLVSTEKKKIFDEIAEGLVLTQADKFKKLAEAISFDGDLEVYKGKLLLVKENFVTKDEPKKPANIDLNESVEADENVKINNPVINRYSQAIKNSLTR